MNTATDKKPNTKNGQRKLFLSIEMKMLRKILPVVVKKQMTV